ncbi:hypothetical protein [Desulfospira joergensenii]|uniref:hypothetical protein n=1 Tax=Desulfospira joergensenii TaxID=53329 RepID=UPI00129467F9|nr:hypothetical protein [Desulfospira joergensenii]
MRIIALLSCVLLFLSCSSCDDKKEDYSGLTELVAQRQKARKALSGKSSDSVSSKPGIQTEKEDSGTKKQEDLSSKTLYSKRVEIIDPSTGTPLARGMAYLTKEGDIVKIKIIKE